MSSGNRPDALPPGLSTGLALVMNGRLPTDSGEVFRAGVTGEVLAGGVGVLVPAGGGAVTVTVAETCGFLGKFAAVAIAVRRTDVTPVAEAATGICARSWRWAEFASTAPRSHDEVPLWVPHPKLNADFTPAGAACRLTVASGTLPPTVQALTVHCAVCPRWILDWPGCTATQRLTCEGVAAAGTMNATAVIDEVGLPDGLGVVDAGLPVVADWVADGELLDFVGLAVLALGETLPDADAEGVGAVSAVGLGDAEPLGVGVPVGGLVLGVAVGLVGVGVGVGVGLGDGAGSCSGSHCCTVVAVVTVNSAAAAPGRLALAADAVAENPVALAARTPPVTKPTTAGCTCAKRMRGPAQCCSLLRRNDYSVWSGYIRRGAPGSCSTPPIGHQGRRMAPPPTLTRRAPKPITMPETR